MGHDFIVKKRETQNIWMQKSSNSTDFPVPGPGPAENEPANRRQKVLTTTDGHASVDAPPCGTRPSPGRRRYSRAAGNRRHRSRPPPTGLSPVANRHFTAPHAGSGSGPVAGPPGTVSVCRLGRLSAPSRGMTRYVPVGPCSGFATWQLGQLLAQLFEIGQVVIDQGAVDFGILHG